MAKEQSEFSRQLAQMTERLQKLPIMQERVVAAMREIQDVMTFDAHPELVALDDELDILYRGQL